MIKNIKIQNILNIIENFKSMKPNKYTYQKIYENIYLNVSYKFFKLNGSYKIKM